MKKMMVFVDEMNNVNVVGELKCDGDWDRLEEEVEKEYLVGGMNVSLREGDEGDVLMDEDEWVVLGYFRSIEV